MKGTTPRRPAEHGAARQMPFAVRPLGVEDVAQAAEIERDAFPETFPPTSFTRELGNRVARYLVAWRREEVESDETPNPYVDTEEEVDGGQGGVRRFIRNARGLLPWRTTAWEPGTAVLDRVPGHLAGAGRGAHRFGGSAHRVPGHGSG